MAHLDIETRDGTRRVALDRERLSIGRLSYNDVVLPFSQISRQHAELRYLQGQWWIADLHSTNGLHINGRRVQEHTLSHGDRIVLAPDITVVFSQESAHEAPPAGRRAPEGASGDRYQHPSDQMTQHPTIGPAPTGQPIVPLRPRSVYSDDEVPYVPPGMAAGGLNSPTPPPNASFTSGMPPVASSWPPPASPGFPDPRASTGGSGGYPAPPGPLNAGYSSSDLFRRDAASTERPRTNSGPASKLLHVCQTCGQLTSPDSVYCQNCHNSIAQECTNCRLSLLPIQERCPRCHAPNQSSVRRAHPGRASE